MKKLTRQLLAVYCIFVSTDFCMAQSWNLAGNSGTDPSTQFIGTTDNKAFKIRTNNTVRISISSTGKVGIGNSSPIFKLDVKGGSINTDSLYRIAGVQVLKRSASNNIEIGTGGAKVGIGIVSPDARLNVENTNMTGITTTGAFQIGKSNTYNLVMDNNEIQTRYNGANGTLYLQHWGGNIDLCSPGGTTRAYGPFEAISTLRCWDKFGIGTAPAYDLHVASTAYTAAYIVSPYNGGNVANVIASGTTSGTWGLYAYATTLGYAAYFSGNVFCTGNYLPSDEILKENIQPLNNSLEKIMKLNVKTYNFKSGLDEMNLPTEKQFGFLAQNLESVFPELVKLNPAKKEQPIEFKAVNYIGLIPILTEAMQEQQKQIETQNITITDLQNELNDLKQSVQSILTNSNEKHTSLMLLKEDSKLFQNQPNPFNQTTTIRYQLTKEPAGSTIIIRDLNGKMVKSFVNLKPGNGQVTVSANELPAGTYTYSLVVMEECIETKLMVITN